MMMQIVVMTDKDIAEMLSIMIEKRNKVWKGAQLFELMHCSMPDFVATLKFLSIIDAVNVEVQDDMQQLNVSLNTSNDFTRTFAQYHDAVHDVLVEQDMINPMGGIPDLEEYIRNYNDIDKEDAVGRHISQRLRELDEKGQLDSFINFVNSFK